MTLLDISSRRQGRSPETAPPPEAEHAPVTTQHIEEIKALVERRRRASLPTFLGRLGMTLLGLTMVGTFLIDRGGDRLDSEFKQELVDLNVQASEINQVMSEVDPNDLNDLGPFAEDVREFFVTFEDTMIELGVVQRWDCDDLNREHDLESIRAQENWC